MTLIQWLLILGAIVATIVITWADPDSVVLYVVVALLLFLGLGRTQVEAPLTFRARIMLMAVAVVLLVAAFTVAFLKPGHTDIEIMRLTMMLYLLLVAWVLGMPRR